MARGRMISQTVATDKRLNALSENAELAFLKTIPHLDRDGIIIGDPVLLAAQVCPRRPTLGAMMPEIMQEWLDADLVILYDPGEDPLLFFPGFSKNQVGLRYEREPASLYPPPPGYYRNGNGIEPVVPSPSPVQSSDDNTPPTSGNIPEGIRQHSGENPADCRLNRIEENRIEVEVKENKTSSAARADSPNGEGDGKPQKAKFKKTEEPPEVIEHRRQLKAAWLQASGYQNFNDAQVNTGIKQLATGRCTPEEVSGCFEWIKSDTWWADKEVYPQTIFKKLDEYRRFLQRKINNHGNTNKSGPVFGILARGAHDAARAAPDPTAEEIERFRAERRAAKAAGLTIQQWQQQLTPS